jgi:hypothetical protein
MSELAGAAIFVAVSVSGIFICQILRTIADHLLQIRQLCAGIDARYKMESEGRAHRRLMAREKREASGA